MAQYKEAPGDGSGAGEGVPRVGSYGPDLVGEERGALGENGDGAGSGRGGVGHNMLVREGGGGESGTVDRNVLRGRVRHHGGGAGGTGGVGDDVLGGGSWLGSELEGPSVGGGEELAGGGLSDDGLGVTGGSDEASVGGCQRSGHDHAALAAPGVGVGVVGPLNDFGVVLVVVNVLLPDLFGIGEGSVGVPGSVGHVENVLLFYFNFFFLLFNCFGLFLGCPSLRGSSSVRGSLSYAENATIRGLENVASL